MAAALTANNRRVRARAHDAEAANPRPLSDDDEWRRRFESAYPTIRAEWDAFRAADRRLPLMEQLIEEHQGNEGDWHAGLLVHNGHRSPTLAEWFPGTLDALDAIPGMRFALWSVLDAGTELPEHTGPNAGVLRLHLGIDCPGDTALQVNDTVVPYRDGVTVLFDDTEPHAAWNRGTRERVTLFCEVLRPTPGLTSVLNRLVQAMLAMDPRYRNAPRRARELDGALNG